MKLGLLTIIGEKLLDKALDGALESVADGMTIEKIKKMNIIKSLTNSL